jgi:outer membrane protein assembly factor BamB
VRRRCLVALTAIVAVLAAGTSASSGGNSGDGEDVTGPYGRFPEALGAAPPVRPARIIASTNGPVHIVGGLALLADGDTITLADGQHRRAGQNGITAIGLGDGRPYWTYQRKDAHVELIRVSGDDAYVLWNDGLLVRFDARRAKARWRRHHVAVERLWVIGDTVLLVHPGAITALDARTGQRRWANRADSNRRYLETAASPAYLTGNVIVAHGENGSSDVVAYDLRTGRMAWQRTVPLAPFPLVLGASTVVLGGPGEHTLLDGLTGREAGRLPSDGDLQVTAGNLAFGEPSAREDPLMAWDQTGHRRWSRHAHPGQAYDSPPVADDGVLYVTEVGGKRPDLRLWLSSLAAGTGRTLATVRLPALIPDGVTAPTDRRRYLAETHTTTPIPVPGAMVVYETRYDKTIGALLITG